MRIATLFPECVVTVEATDEMWHAALFAAEEIAIRNARPKRRREFAAGRACARVALARLGVPQAVLPVGLDRLPLWPAGILGSISHCDTTCAVAVARRDDLAGLGLDVERADPLDEGTVSMVCAEEELEDARRRSGLHRGVAAKLLFSAKEAVYKCCYPLLRERWDFDEVRIQLESPDAFVATPRGRSALHGRYVVDSDRILTTVTIR